MNEMKKVILTMVVLAVSVSASAQSIYADSWDPDADADGNVGVTDLLALLSVFGDYDLDNDGIWDSVDDCVGAYDECGVCNGPGPSIEVIESITILYDSVYADQIDEWWVFEVGADTIFNYFCVTQLNDSNIHEAVDLWLLDEAAAAIIYGHISSWDVSDVTNMSSLFEEASDFNGDISAWDVSNVTDMSYLFWNCHNFNGDISTWDVSNVTNMSYMFRKCFNFNGDISSWDVSSANNLSGLFEEASSFNRDISLWNVSNVTDMSHLFNGAVSFNGDISAWDVSNVNTMFQTFRLASSFNGDISSWDVSSVGSMRLMFWGCPIFNSDISDWDVSSVWTMYRMFNAPSFDRDISSWDVSSVTHMTDIFENTSLSDENKCAIHTSFSSNPLWQYEWAEFCPFSCGDPVNYYGYDYATVQIGEQCWFGENLRTELYANGDSIPAGLSGPEWNSTISGASAVYGEDPVCDNYSPDGDACDEIWSLIEYGRLYNWYAVDEGQGLCPTGWHVPGDSEWMTLESELGMSWQDTSEEGWRGTNQGTQMKTSYGWFSSGYGNNLSGFSGLPGGDRSPNGSFDYAGYSGSWWSSSSSNSTLAWCRYLAFEQPGVFRNDVNKRDGFSVRCIKDSE